MCDIQYILKYHDIAIWYRIFILWHKPNIDVREKSTQDVNVHCNFSACVVSCTMLYVQVLSVYMHKQSEFMYIAIYIVSQDMVCNNNREREFSYIAHHYYSPLHTV